MNADEKVEVRPCATALVRDPQFALRWTAMVDGYIGQEVVAFPPLPKFIDPRSRETECILAEGRIRVFLPRHDVVMTQVAGHFSLGLAPFLTDVTDSLIAHGQRFVVYQDWSNMSGYDSMVRKRLTYLTLVHRDMVEGSHILVRSKMVSMGVAAAGAALSVAGMRLHSYSTRADFEEALQARMNKSPSRPSAHFRK